MLILGNNGRSELLLRIVKDSMLCKSAQQQCTCSQLPVPSAISAEADITTAGIINITKNNCGS